MGLSFKPDPLKWKMCACLWPPSSAIAFSEFLLKAEASPSHRRKSPHCVHGTSGPHPALLPRSPSDVQFQAPHALTRFPMLADGTWSGFGGPWGQRNRAGFFRIKWRQRFPSWASHPRHRLRPAEQASLSHLPDTEVYHLRHLWENQLRGAGETWPQLTPGEEFWHSHFGAGWLWRLISYVHVSQDFYHGPRIHEHWHIWSTLSTWWWSGMHHFISLKAISSNVVVASVKHWDFLKLPRWLKWSQDWETLLHKGKDGRVVYKETSGKKLFLIGLLGGWKQELLAAYCHHKNTCLQKEATMRGHCKAGAHGFTGAHGCISS